MADITDQGLCIDLAKDLMDWDFWDATEGPPGFPMFAALDGSDELALYEDEETGDMTRLWAPLENMNDAWEIVEKLSTLPLSVQCRFVTALNNVDVLPTKMHLALKAAAVLSLDFRLLRFLFCVDPRAAICHAAWEAIQTDDV